MNNEINVETRIKFDYCSMRYTKAIRILLSCGIKRMASLLDPGYLFVNAKITKSNDTYQPCL